MTGGLAEAVCDRALKPGEAPDWVHLFPPGQIVGRDGREFDLADPGAVVLAFEGNGADLPIDYGHQNDAPAAKLAGPVRAAGWIKELAARPDGLWGRVEWTAAAREMIGNREYRYLSPSFYYERATKAITRLKGAGLVHSPNFHLKALAAEERGGSEADGFRHDLAQAMGLPPETEAAELLAALRRILEVMRNAAGAKSPLEATAEELVAAVAVPDPAKFVPVATVQAMLKERNEGAATASKERAERKVAEAMQRGHLTPAMRDWALALCASDEASFDAFLSKSAAPYAHLSRRTVAAAAPPERSLGSNRDPDTLAICAQLGLAPERLEA